MDETLAAAAPFRVLIVDDEYYFRKLLVHLVDWNALGYEIAMEAEDGLQALELARRESFHLIIADIHMPRLSGLEFVKELRKSNKDTKVLFITSHGEFEYAKLAVALGASGYLMKPVDESELETALHDINREIGQQQSLIMQAELAKPYLRERFVRQLLCSEPSETWEAILNHAINVQIPTDDKAYAVIAVQFDELHARFEQEADRRRCSLSVKDIANRTFQALGSCCMVMEGSENTIIILAGMKQAEASILNERCEQLLSRIGSSLHLPATIAYGRIYERLDQVHQSYAEAAALLKNKFAKGGNCVIGYRQGHEGGSGAGWQSHVNRNDWLVAIRLKDLPAISLRIGELCRKLAETRTSKDMALLSLRDCISVAAAAIMERGETLPAGWMDEEHPLFRQLHRLETVAGMRQWMLNFFGEIVFKALEGKDDSSKRSGIVRKAVAFVREHFANEELTLQMTAKELFVNPSYLSHLFKKETGQSFIEYLSDLRLEQAMELLQTSSDNLADIACRVGYSDPYYFSKCFKKKYGIAPKKMNA